MDTGFNTLKIFENPDLNKTTPGAPFEPFAPIREIENQKVQEDVNNLALDTAEKNATEAVENEPFMNAASDYYAGVYIPTLQQKQLNMQAAMDAMNYGKRVTPQDFKGMIEQSIGPIPETPQTEKAFRFLLDSLRAKTPYQGATGAFDQILQATELYMGRRDLENANKIKRQLAIGEMAAKQAMDMNKIQLEKEAELELKNMGYNESAIQEMMSFNSDVKKDLLQYDLDKAKLAEEHALIMMRNPEKAFPTLMYSDDGGKTFKTEMVQVVPNPVNGNPMIALPRYEEGPDGKMYPIFDQPVPENYSGMVIYNGDDPGTAAKSKGQFGANQIAETAGKYFSLVQSADVLGDVLKENAASVQAGKGSTLGVEGLIRGGIQEGKFILYDLLNTIQGPQGPGFGTTLEDIGKQAARESRMLDQAYQDGKSSLDGDTDFDKTRLITYEVPKTNAFGITTTQTISENTSLGDMLNVNYYQSLGYNDVYAKNKVRENYVIYALARALKSTGRLNVDDIQRASQILNITGFESSAAVATKLEAVRQLMLDAAYNTVMSAQTGDYDIRADNTTLGQDFGKRYGQGYSSPNYNSYGNNMPRNDDAPSMNENSPQGEGQTLVNPDEDSFNVNINQLDFGGTP